MDKFDISKLPFDHIGVVVKDMEKAIEHRVGGMILEISTEPIGRQ